ncbi:MAG TPA: DUF899 family protein [Candidatus Dormibacteraeota bacterium]|jgi:predicted dithiol-disulfide oxidoreductase (DUF899 family)
MASAKRLHKTRFPGEDTAYRDARDSLLRSEIELRRNIEAVAAQRRKLPLGGEIPTDYEFKGWSPKDDTIDTIHFSDLFARGKDTLFLYNFMFPESLESDSPCPSCTSIIDAVDGAVPHVTQRINFAVVAKGPIGKFRDHARRRGWRNSLLLSAGRNTFKRDYHLESPEGFQFPIAQVFVKRSGKIRHFWSSELWWAKPDKGQDMRHVDFMWPMWSIFDTTPEGRGTSWGPELKYG